MERPFRIADALSRDEIRALTRTSNAWGAVSVAWTWLVIAAVFAALAQWPHPLTFVAAVIVLGGRQLALAVLTHEGAHGTLFRTRWLNEQLVDWICARPLWSDVARYRHHHLQHHAHTSTERDPDLALALPQPMTRRSLRRKIVRDLVGASGVRRVIGLAMVDAELLGYTVGGAADRLPWRGVGAHLGALVRNASKAVIANAVLLGVLAALGHAWVFTAWIAAYLTVFSLVLRVRSLAEHACMEPGPDPVASTRTVDAGLAARTIVAPLHVNLHLEHHMLPTVPWYRLPALRRMLEARGAIPAGARASGYREVLRLVSARG